MLDTLESFLSRRHTVFKSPAQQGLCLAYFETLEVYFVHTNSFPAVLGSAKDMPERTDTVRYIFFPVFYALRILHQFEDGV